jgi:hypothetical protein
MKQLMIDPPSGWRYGFPKAIPANMTDHEAWLIENGYPATLIEQLGEHFYCRYWYQDEDDE